MKLADVVALVLHVLGGGASPIGREEAIETPMSSKVLRVVVTAHRPLAEKRPLKLDLVVETLGGTAGFAHRPLAEKRPLKRDEVEGWLIDGVQRNADWPRGGD